MNNNNKLKGSASYNSFISLYNDYPSTNSLNTLSKSSINTLFKPKSKESVKTLFKPQSKESVKPKKPVKSKESVKSKEPVDNLYRKQYLEQKEKEKTLLGAIKKFISQIETKNVQVGKPYKKAVKAKEKKTKK